MNKQKQKSRMRPGEAKELLREWLERNPGKWRDCSYREIARQTGVSLTATHRYIPKLVAEMEGSSPGEVCAERRAIAEPKRAASRVSKKEIEQMRELRSRGLTDAQIAEKVGRSLPTVRKYLNGQAAAEISHQPEPAPADEVSNVFSEAIAAAAPREQDSDTGSDFNWTDQEIDAYIAERCRAEEQKAQGAPEYGITIYNLGYEQERVILKLKQCGLPVDTIAERINCEGWMVSDCINAAIHATMAERKDFAGNAINW